MTDSCSAVCSGVLFESYIPPLQPHEAGATVASHVMFCLAFGVEVAALTSQGEQEQYNWTSSGSGAGMGLITGKGK